MAKSQRQVVIQIETAASALAVLKSLIAEKLHEDDRKDIDQLLEKARDAIDLASDKLAELRQRAEAALDDM